MNQIAPIILIVLDGWGMAPDAPGNALSKAQIPNFKNLCLKYPNILLKASGSAVGLPENEVGNSETGHLNLGAGRIVLQELPKINETISQGSFFQNQAILGAINHAKIHHAKLHLLGLIGKGGIHSSNEHLFALLKMAKMHKLNQVFLHLFTDGRDSFPTSSLEYLELIEKKINEYQCGKIASLMGRYFAMDRDYHWSRTKIAYEALTEGKGTLTLNYKKAILHSYLKKKTDEFIKPIIIAKNSKDSHLINDNDSVIFYNYRIDRPRQLTKALVLPNFEDLVWEKKSFDPYQEKYQTKNKIVREKPFKRNKILKNLCFVTMTEYEKGLPVLVAFPQTPIKETLAQTLAKEKIRQLHLSETEKERHVTYYFDGRVEQPNNNEDWVEIPSLSVATYDLKPEMSCLQISQTLLQRLELNIYQFILVNFANPDMVGHTGNLAAGIKACEAVDQALGIIVKKALNLKATVIVTADHGNVEEMIDLKTGKVDTNHSTNPVPFILIEPKGKIHPITAKSGKLGDVAPTILKLFDLQIPSLMNGKLLI